MCHRKKAPTILQTYSGSCTVHAQITWSGTMLVDTRPKQLLIHVFFLFLKHINLMPENSVVFQVLQIDKNLHVSGSPNLMTMHSFIKNYEMINSSNLGVGGPIQCLSKKNIK